MNDPPDDDDPFRDAVGDVTPLTDRDKRRPPAPPRRSGAAPEAPSPEAFRIERVGERVTGLAQGIDNRHLQRLIQGEVEVEARLDLHGLSEAASLAALRQLFERARGDAARCLLVIHGRGLHSGGSPVLRDAVLSWLTTPPQARRVMAFSSAAGRHGGPGALYILLRRDR